jgi:hypothetical protein
MSASTEAITSERTARGTRSNVQLASEGPEGECTLGCERSAGFASYETGLPISRAISERAARRFSSGG